MLRYIAERVAATIPVLLGVTILSFAMLHLMPGDPVRLLMSSFDAATGAAEIERVREKFGLNDPLPIQYIHFLSRALTGDLGTSVLKARPVSQMILNALPNSLQLAGLSVLIGVLIGGFLGIVAAVTHHTWVDSVSIFGSLLAVSIPDFALAIVVILVVSVDLGWLPSSGSAGWQYLILPAFVLGTRLAASIARLTRSTMLEVLGKQYIVSARAKGLPSEAVVIRHALRNALIPVVTFIGLDFGRLLGGTVVVETIFARQGLGKLLIDAILDHDVAVLQGTILFVAVGYVVVNLLVDLSYAWLDPRIRYA